MNLSPSIKLQRMALLSIGNAFPIHSPIGRLRIYDESGFLVGILWETLNICLTNFNG